MNNLEKSLYGLCLAGFVGGIANAIWRDGTANEIVGYGFSLLSLAGVLFTYEHSIKRRYNEMIERHRKKKDAETRMLGEVNEPLKEGFYPSERKPYLN